MGTLRGFASPFGPPPASSSPLASLGLAIPWRSGSRTGSCGSSRQSVGEARLRPRDPTWNAGAPTLWPPLSPMRSQRRVDDEMNDLAPVFSAVRLPLLAGPGAQSTRLLIQCLGVSA
jgi:hypothetical protein